MKLIASYSKPEEAHLAASLLEGNGITVNVRDADTVGNYWMYSNAVGGVKIEVLETEEEKAREILNLPKEATEILACPHCGSGNVKIREMNIFTAISIALGFVIPFASKKIDCMVCTKSFELDLKKRKADPDGAGQRR
jgi:DNA-directed RNA polymerase subunit RPC12/RpoP